MITAEPKRGEHLLWTINDEDHNRMPTSEIARNGDAILFTLTSSKPFTNFTLTMTSNLLPGEPERTASFHVKTTHIIRDHWQQAEQQAEAIAREWLALLPSESGQPGKPTWTTLVRYDDGKPRSQELKLNNDIRLLLSITWPYTDFILTIQNTSLKHTLHIYDKTEIKAESKDLNEAWQLVRPKAEDIARTLFQKMAEQLTSALENLQTGD